MTTRDALLLAHREAADALETPAVRFVARRKQAAFAVAVFRTAFGPEASQIQTHALHLLVEQAQSELRFDHTSAVPEYSDSPPGQY